MDIRQEWNEQNNTWNIFLTGEIDITMPLNLKPVC